MRPARLLEAGFGDTDIDRIFDLVPLATHNQRGTGTLYLGTESRLSGEALAGIVEQSMSSPIFELLKRPDELFVVEHAHLQPRFVEDCVRVMIGTVLDVYATELGDDDFVEARQVNFETIHNHDVLAERFGLVGELRRELRDGGALEEPPRAPRLAQGQSSRLGRLRPLRRAAEPPVHQGLRLSARLGRARPARSAAEGGARPRRIRRDRRPRHSPEEGGEAAPLSP